VKPQRIAASPATSTTAAATNATRVSIATIHQEPGPGSSRTGAGSCVDVCGLSVVEVANTIGTNVTRAKATLRRARAAIDRARGRTDVDVPVDSEVVERLARALESRAVDALGRSRRTLRVLSANAYAQPARGWSTARLVSLGILAACKHA
jgi:hypothetical protein